MTDKSSGDEYVDVVKLGEAVGGYVIPVTPYGAIFYVLRMPVIRLISYYDNTEKFNTGHCPICGEPFMDDCHDDCEEDG